MQGVHELFTEKCYQDETTIALLDIKLKFITARITVKLFVKVKILNETVIKSMYHIIWLM